MLVADKIQVQLTGGVYTLEDGQGVADGGGGGGVYGGGV